MPESTLTPAPVRTAAFPGARKVVIRSTAAAEVYTFVDVDGKTPFGIVGMVILMQRAEKLMSSRRDERQRR